MVRDQHGGDRVWHRYAPGVASVRLVTASFRTHRFLPHAHSEYAIAVIERGVEAVRYRGGTERAPAGSLLLLDAEVPHAGRPGGDEGWDYRVFYVPPELVVEIAGYRPTFRSCTPADPRLAARLRRTHQLLLRPGVSALQAQESLLGTLSLVLTQYGSRAPTATGGGSGVVRRLQRYLVEDLRRTPSLDELAAVVELSRFRLLRAFRRETGLTPHGYLVQARLRHAQQLLTAGCTVAEAATDSGFYDQAHLHRHFRRTFAATPGSFARAARNDVQAPRRRVT